MLKVNIHEAKAQLASLVDKAVAGEPFIIARNGEPLVVVSSYSIKKSVPRIGFLRGKIQIPDDFNSMDAGNISSSFEHD